MSPKTPAHLSSLSDDWPTPADFYAALEAEFGFVVDVCASPTNHKAPAYYGLAHPDPARRDGLAGDWVADATRLGGTVWMNPPYGRHIGDWMAKALATARGGATVVTLVPVRADTAWWHEYVLATGAEVRFVRGRLTFGQATNTAAFASAVVVYRPTDIPGGPGPVGVMGNHPEPPARDPGDVAAYVAGYSPRLMTPARWALAAPAVRSAVLASRPSTTGAASSYLAALVFFLEAPTGWEGAGTPDLRALLTEAAIASAIDHMPGSRTDNHRAATRCALRTVAEALGCDSIRGTRGPGTRPPRDPQVLPLVHAAQAALPFPALHAAWQGKFGERLPERVMRHACKLVATANATSGPTVTFATPATLRLLAAATDQYQGTARMEATTSSDRRAGTRQRGNPPQAARLSRRAALTAARTNLRATQPPTVAPAPDPDTLPHAIAEAVASYRPRQMSPAEWEPVADLVRRMVVGYRPASPRNALSAASHVSRFVKWFSTWPGRTTASGPVEAHELLRDGLVETYMQVASVSPTSQATVRSVLRRAVGSLNPAGMPKRFRRNLASPPYDAAHCAHIVTLSRHQPTPARRRNLAFIVGLGLGAGLDARDLRAVRASDLTRVMAGVEKVLTVDVNGPRGRRLVPVRRSYEALVQEALDLHAATGRGPGDLVIGVEPTRTQVTGPATRRAVSADTRETVDIDPQRLRNTWLVAAMCSPVPLADLLRAAGLRSATALVDLLPYCPKPDPSAVAAALAALNPNRIGVAL